MKNRVKGNAEVYTTSLKRFEKLRRFLHFVDNMTHDPAAKDKLFKISPILQKVREQCLKIPPEEYHSVDEQIIPAKTKIQWNKAIQC